MNRTSPAHSHCGGHEHSPEFSVIVTSYYEEQSIDEFFRRLRDTMVGLGRSFEIILVNDGSTDRTFERHRAIFESEACVTAAIDLFRNSGQVCAMSAGIAHANGEHFIFIDSDLQLDPEEIPNLIGVFDQGWDIVSGCRTQRRDSFIRRLPSIIANMVMRRVSRHPMTDFGCTYKVYNGELVRAFGFGPYKAWATAYVYAKAQWVKEVPISHHERRYGKSGYTLKKLMDFLFDHLIGISSRPFQILSILCVLFAVILLLRILFTWLLSFSILPAVTPGLILNALLLHLLVVLSVLAAIGEYIFRSFSYLKRDPIYVVRERLTREPKPAESE